MTEDVHAVSETQPYSFKKIRDERRAQPRDVVIGRERKSKMAVAALTDRESSPSALNGHLAESNHVYAASESEDLDEEGGVSLEEVSFVV